MKGMRSEALEGSLLKAIQDGDDARAQDLERRILQKQRKQQTE